LSLIEGIVVSDSAPAELRRMFDHRPLVVFQIQDIPVTLLLNSSDSSTALFVVAYRVVASKCKWSLKAAMQRSPHAVMRT
jgi:hypothetical protein